MHQISKIIKQPLHNYNLPSMIPDAAYLFNYLVFCLICQKVMLLEALLLEDLCLKGGRENTKK